MSAEDEQALRIKQMLDEAKRKADEASAAYLANVLNLLISTHPEMSMAEHLRIFENAMQEGNEATERMKPLAPIMVPVFTNPRDCDIYNAAVSQVVTLGMTSPKPYPDLTDGDIDSALNFMTLLHSPHCPNPHSHQQ